MATQSKKDAPQLVLPYHQPALFLLHKELVGELQKAHLDKPAQLLTDLFTKSLPINIRINPEHAWDACYEILNRLEENLSSILSSRSSFFWMHLYRRIGVALHPGHKGKTDSRTLGLVRNIVELAILKFGLLNRQNELKLSNCVKPEEIFGGYFVRGLENLFKNNSSTILNSFTESFLKQPEWVIEDFRAPLIMPHFGDGRFNQARYQAYL